MSAETDIQFEVWQDGHMVASADSLSDAQHFMVIYGQDGPVEAKTAVTTRTPGFNVRTPAPEGEACPTCNGVCPEFCSNAFHLASPVVPAPEGEAWTARHIVFDGPPDHNGPRFIEVETPEGKSVNAGEWRQRPDNLWELVIASPVVPVGVSEADINELRVVCDTNQAATDDSRIVRADDLPIGVIRRILAALRPTDTGANHD